MLGNSDMKRLTDQESHTAVLHQELETRLNKLSAAGAIDLKVTGSGNPNSSTVDMLWTLNNILRRSDEGKTSTSVIEG